MLLFKFSKRAYLADFRDGTLHMNSQQYFSELENTNSVKGDKFEGTDQIHQPKDIKSLRIIDNERGTAMEFGSNILAGPLLINFGHFHYNLFCMHTVTNYPEKNTLLVDERNFLFGDFFLVITNNQELVNRISSSVKAANLEVLYGPVEYHDASDYSGETGPFWKTDIHSYQREFRIVVYPGSSNPIRLSIGSLEDITTPIYPLADINRIVQLPPSRS